MRPPPFPSLAMGVGGFYAMHSSNTSIGGVGAGGGGTNVRQVFTIYSAIGTQTINPSAALFVGL